MGTARVPKARRASLARAILLESAAGAPITAPAQGAPNAPKTDGAAIVRGAGETKPDGAKDWHQASTGDVVTAGITVRAASDQPLELLLPDAVTITLEPGATARWMSASKLPTETNGWTRGYHLVLIDGELEVRMPPGPKGTHAFLVQTRHGTLTDWRGQLHVLVASGIAPPRRSTRARSSSAPTAWASPSTTALAS